MEYSIFSPGYHIESRQELEIKDILKLFNNTHVSVVEQF